MARALLLGTAMKIDGAIFPGRAAVQPKPSFASLLKQPAAALHKTALPPPLPSKPRTLPTVAPKQPPSTHAGTNLARSTQQIFSNHEKAGAALSIARTAAHQQAAHLQDARAVHHQVATERLDTRLVDLICKELVIEFAGDGSKSRVANQDLPLAPPTPSTGALPVGTLSVFSPPSSEAPHAGDGTVKAAQAVELIERIETFIKDSRRPCIALTLNNSLGAKVEIERVGPREVALKVIGHKGPPPAEDISRIRDEMRARGLKVCALSVG